MGNVDWSESIIALKGIGNSTFQKFASLGIETIQDLMFHFPFRYEDIQERDIDTIIDGEKVSIRGTVVSSPHVNYYGRKKSRLQFKLNVNQNQLISVIFFNQPYISKQINLGQEIVIYGKWQSHAQNIIGMKIIPIKSQGQHLEPIYSTTQGLRQNQIRNAIEQAFLTSMDSIQELLPEYINEKYHFITLKQALYQIHFPKDIDDYYQAERKIIYLEFFFYQWGIQNSFNEIRNQLGIQVLYDNHTLKEYIQSIPFELTEAQKQVVNEICFDLRAQYPMRRMLQGDVGSGKTIVAFIAMVAAVIAGYQAALMVPTEILARQHWESFNLIFEKMGLYAELLTGTLKQKEKDRITEGLESGNINVVIGTHSLFQDAVSFKNLALAIIDEQHRFGVQQRQKLMDKNRSTYQTNILQMTATPIPRTLAQTIYGDMTISTIDHLPLGRLPIITQVILPDHIQKVYDAMFHQLKMGHQIYFVLPLIDYSEVLEEIENIKSTVEHLSKIFSDYQIDVLHGQLNKQDQEEVMEAFHNNQVHILVATTMVEVGINVPNATMIVIQSAERFGLAQLHQLRGRVGRSSIQSYCYLIGHPTTEEGKERLEIMAAELNGFKISQEDMKIRGSGDILGIAQSGLPTFKYANLYEDQIIHKHAKVDVHLLQDNIDLLKNEELVIINQWLEKSRIQI